MDNTKVMSEKEIVSQLEILKLHCMNLEEIEKKSLAPDCCASQWAKDKEALEEIITVMKGESKIIENKHIEQLRGLVSYTKQCNMNKDAMALSYAISIGLIFNTIHIGMEK